MIHRSGSYSRFSVFCAFFIYSFMLGTLFPRLADLQQQMTIQEGTLGLSLIGLPLGLQISLLFSNRILSILSVRLIMMMGIPAMGLMISLAAWSNHPLSFFIALFFAGLTVGPIEVAVNLEADRTEYQISERLMNRAHGFWSLGFGVTSVLGAIMAQMAVTPVLHMLMFTAISTCACLVTFWTYEQAPPRSTEVTQEAMPLIIKPTRFIMVLVGLSLSAALVEGSTIDWSVIYMRDIFQTPPLINGSALALAAFSQFLVRFFADTVIERHGPIPIARYSLVCMFVGVSCVSFAQTPVIALIGFILMGAGCAVIFPLAMSAAAQQTDRAAVINVASLAQITFFLFLLAPPLLGFVAEHVGVRYSIGVSLILIVLSWMNVHGLSVISLKSGKPV